MLPYIHVALGRIHERVDNHSIELYASVIFKNFVSFFALFFPNQMFATSQQAVSGTFKQNEAQTVDHFYRFKKTCCTKGGPESKMHIMQNHFLFRKDFHRRAEFSMEAAERISRNLAKISFSILSVIYCMCWRLYFGSWTRGGSFSQKIESANPARS